jgi:hypothetical protein
MSASEYVVVVLRGGGVLKVLGPMKQQTAEMLVQALTHNQREGVALPLERP